jgi:hypothetical protein
MLMIVCHSAAVIPDVLIELDQVFVIASEGNAAVVCASATFNNEFRFDTIVSTELSAIVGTAGEKNKNY